MVINHNQSVFFSLLDFRDLAKCTSSSFRHLILPMLMSIVLKYAANNLEVDIQIKTKIHCDLYCQNKLQQNKK